MGEHSEDISHVIKCGEVVLQNKCKFAVMCNFCQEIFADENSFIMHILSGKHANELNMEIDTDLPSNEHDNAKLNDLEKSTVSFFDNVDVIVLDNVLFEDDTQVYLQDENGAITIVEGNCIREDTTVAVFNQDNEGQEESNNAPVSQEGVLQSILAKNFTEDLIVNNESSNSLPRDIHETTYDGNDSLLKQIDELIATEELRLSIQWKNQAVQNTLQSPNINDDESTDENKENSPPNNSIVVNCHENDDGLVLKSRSEPQRPPVNCDIVDSPVSAPYCNDNGKNDDTPKRSVSISRSGLLKRKLVEQKGTSETIASKRFNDDVASTSKNTSLNSGENVSETNVARRCYVITRKGDVNKTDKSLHSAYDGQFGFVVDPSPQFKRECISKNVQVSSNIHTIAAVNSFQSSQIDASTPIFPHKNLQSTNEVNDELSLDSTCKVEKIDSIQFDTFKLAKESNMEAVGLLDVSAISLPEQTDLDASVTSPTLSATTLDDNAQLLDAVGLLFVRNPTLDKTLTLAEEMDVHGRTSVFAEILRANCSIWRLSNNANIENAFCSVASQLNNLLCINLTVKDLKGIVNEFFDWYKNLHQQHLEKKKTPPKELNYYLKLFSFLPKLARYGIFCEQCVAIFRSKDDYIEHKQQTHQMDGMKQKDSKVALFLRQRADKCVVCGKKFATVKLLYEHTKMHLEKIKECGQCSRVFATNDELRYHINHFHNEKTDQADK